MDGTFINRQHYESVALGLFRKVPLMISNVLDEGMFFIGARIIWGDMTPTSLKTRLLPYFTKEDHAQLDNLYPTENSVKQYHNLSNVLSDYYFHCPSRRMAIAYRNQGLPVTRTFFKHFLSAASAISQIKNMGVVHGSDIPFWVYYN